MTARAQAFTLEALMAAIVLVASLVFALGIAGVTPLSASTASEQVENQLDGTAAGLLDGAEANGTLRPTLLYWNGTAGGFHGASEDHYVSRAPPTRFGEALQRTFGDRNVAYNVNVHYVSADGNRRKQALVVHGTPSDDAVRATTLVTLSDDDEVRGPTGEPTNETLAETSAFYAPDAAPDSPIYNVVVVEVVVWRV